MPGMRQINDAHVAEPGLAVVEVATADDQTAFALQEVLATRWATAMADRTTRVPGEPGVRLRCYLDRHRTAGRWLYP
ncbi:hypothetical protein SAMN02787118_14044 [Streptomyces mirabilis]|uniref:Uncharacterized protein n=2 Tax=Streptomyces mirabilis TaxID=68239 RepID=A0A1I2WY94_9ACTN|nr:hypothetical protein SAMN02787118_14044 [Streptomyces mirabilis]